MNAKLIAIGMMCLVAIFASGASKRKGASADMPASIYEIGVTSIDGRETSLADFRGEVLLVVNVASRCGFTPQYEGLQALHERLGERGLRVLGFPANNFLSQEPGSDEEIREFCSANYGVSFPMFAKISVKGEDIHPLYRFLTGGQGHKKFSGDIGWNFNKFLIDREGNIVGRFGARTKPESDEIVAAIERALGEG